MSEGAHLVEWIAGLGLVTALTAAAPAVVSRRRRTQHSPTNTSTGAPNPSGASVPIRPPPLSFVGRSATPTPGTAEPRAIAQAGSRQTDDSARLPPSHHPRRSTALPASSAQIRATT